MIDARGLSCPMPVVMVQKAVKNEAPNTLEVLVDNECAVENVSRFAKSRGYTAEVTKDGTDSKLVLKK
ncbi:MAG: sulfurtransferase TusA family protein [Oscillospiraceae bacterium]